MIDPCATYLRDVLVALPFQAGEEVPLQRRAGLEVVERERAPLGRLALGARGAEIHRISSLVRWSGVRALVVSFCVGAALLARHTMTYAPCMLQQ